MLHEEVVVDWNSLQRQVQEPKLLESLQLDFVPGVRFISDFGDFRGVNRVFVRVFRFISDGAVGPATSSSAICTSPRSPSGSKKPRNKNASPESTLLKNLTSTLDLSIQRFNPLVLH